MPKKLAVTPEEKKEDAPAPLLKISDIEQLGYITNMLHQLKSMANDQGHRMLSYMIELAELEAKETMPNKDDGIPESHNKPVASKNSPTRM